MAARTAVKTKWIAGTRMHRQAAPLPVISKPFTVDEQTATLGDWLNCYAYLVARPGGENWLRGLVPPSQIKQVAAIVREQLKNAKPIIGGRALALQQF